LSERQGVTSFVGSARGATEQRLGPFAVQCERDAPAFAYFADHAGQFSNAARRIQLVAGELTEGDADNQYVVGDFACESREMPRRLVELLRGSRDIAQGLRALPRCASDIAHRGGKIASRRAWFAPRSAQLPADFAGSHRGSVEFRALSDEFHAHSEQFRAVESEFAVPSADLPTAAAHFASRRGVCVATSFLHMMTREARRGAAAEILRAHRLRREPQTAFHPSRRAAPVRSDVGRDASSARRLKRAAFRVAIAARQRTGGGVSVSFRQRATPGVSATAPRGRPRTIRVVECTVNGVGRLVNALGRLVNEVGRPAIPVGRRPWRDRHMSIMLSRNFTGKPLVTNRQERTTASIWVSLVFLGSLKSKSTRIQLLEQQLGEAYGRIEKALAKQKSDKQSRSRPGNNVRAAKSHLRTMHLKPIAESGPRLLAGLPGIRDSLRMPIAKASVDLHVEAAQRFADNVRPHAKVFWKAGFSRTFLKELDQAARALTKAAADPTSVIAAYSQSTDRVADEIRRGRDLIRELDSAFMAESQRDDILMLGWGRAKRIPARVGRPPKSRPKSRDTPR
jgi:hypothetical protein